MNPEPKDGNPPLPFINILNSEKSWPEDYSHENGKYLNCCSMCGAEFMGHKRRVVCKQCSAPKNQEFNCPPVCEKCNRCHRGECEVPIAARMAQTGQISVLAPCDHDECSKLKCEKPSDTPRTDAVSLTIESGDWNSEKDCTDCALHHAGQLERELNEAREIAKKYEDRYFSTLKERDELLEWKRGQKGIEDYYIVQEKLHATEKERDELRQKLNTLEATESARGIVDRAERAAKKQIDQLNAETARKVAVAEFERLKGKQ